VHILRVAVTIAAVALYVPRAGHAIPFPDEFTGPPSYSIMGCPHDQEWTPEVVSKATGFSKTVLARIKRRFGWSLTQICTGDSLTVNGYARNASQPKHLYDQPDQAEAFRALQLRDERGEIPDNALLRALAERQAILASKSGIAKIAGISSVSWNWLGPGNIGGRVRAISPHPTTPNDIMVGSVSGGVWRTTDGGTSWTPLNDFMPNVAISCLVRDPAAPNTVYACTGEGAFNSDAIRGLGIFKSIDNGATWSHLASTDPATNTDWRFVNRLAISPANSLVMLAATNGGLYRSIDGGTSWIRVYGDLGGGFFRSTFDVAFDPTDGTKALLGEAQHFVAPCCSTVDGNAIAFSSDGGATWTRTKLNTAAITGSSGRVEIAFSKSNPLIVYASVDMLSGQIYRSNDSGQTWTPNVPVSTPAHLGDQGWYANAILVAPNDSNRVVIGGLGLKMSLDGGVNFTNIGNNVHVDHHALVADPGYNITNTTIYNGNDGGVYKATGVNTLTPTGTSPSWTALNNGLGITQFYGVAGKSGGRIGGGAQDNGTLIYSGSTTWENIEGGDGGITAADPTDGNFLYGETQLGGVVRSMNALTLPVTSVTSQTICASILDADCIFGANPNPRILFIPPLTLDPNNPNTLYVGAENLWRSTNVKTPLNTDVVFSNIRPFTSSGDYISAIAVAAGNSNIVWIGTKSGKMYCTTNGTAGSPTWRASSRALRSTPTRIIASSSRSAAIRLPTCT
jgi:photosystem II stability/assembly factor-like uncharacterized protein